MSSQIFYCKNGTTFQHCLIRAAWGDSKVTMMFLDNIKRLYPESYGTKIISIQKRIERSDFVGALTMAFDFNSANEPYWFWNNIKKELINQEYCLRCKK